MDLDFLNEGYLVSCDDFSRDPRTLPAERVLVEGQDQAYRDHQRDEYGKVAGYGHEGQAEQHQDGHGRYLLSGSA